MRYSQRPIGGLPRVCSRAGCTRICAGVRCDEHDVQGRSNIPGWAKFTRALLAAFPWCHCGEPATEVDHIVPRDELPVAQRDHPTNLQTLCKGCHAAKTKIEGRSAGFEVRCG